MPSKCNWTQANQNRRAYQNGTLPHWRDGWASESFDNVPLGESSKGRRSLDKTYVIECSKTESLQIRLRSARQGYGRFEQVYELIKLQICLTNPPHNVRVLAQGFPSLAEDEIQSGWLVLLDFTKQTNPQTLRIFVKDGTLNLVGIWKMPTFSFSNMVFFN